jgi:hypothetical protein
MAQLLLECNRRKRGALSYAIAENFRYGRVEGRSKCRDDSNTFSRGRCLGPRKSENTEDG